MRYPRKRSSICVDEIGTVHQVWMRPDSVRLGVTQCRRDYLTKACKRSDLLLIRRAKPQLLLVRYVSRTVDCIDCLAATEDA